MREFGASGVRLTFIVEVEAASVVEAVTKLVDRLSFSRTNFLSKA